MTEVGGQGRSLVVIPAVTLQLLYYSDQLYLLCLFGDRERLTVG